MLPPYIVGIIKLWAIVRPFLKENFMGKGQMGHWFKQNKTITILFGNNIILATVCFVLMDQLNAFYGEKEIENTKIVLLQTQLNHTEDKVIILSNVIRALNKQPILDMPYPRKSATTPEDPNVPNKPDETKPVTIRSRLDELAMEDYS